MDTCSLAAEIDEELRSSGTPERAAHEKSYLKSDLEHYGVPVPAIRAVATGVQRSNPDLRHEDVLKIVGLLWDAPVHEHRMAAVEV